MKKTLLVLVATLALVGSSFADSFSLSIGVGGRHGGSYGPYSRYPHGGYYRGGPSFGYYHRPIYYYPPPTRVVYYESAPVVTTVQAPPQTVVVQQAAPAPSVAVTPANAPYGVLINGMVKSPWSDFQITAGGKSPGQILYDPNTGQPFRIP